MSPIVSVVLPVFNQNNQFLRESIDSILAQTFSDFELIIIDDGSDDTECREMIASYAERDRRIRLIRNDVNLGIIRSLNKGLRISKGTFIARMDSDDISLPARLQKQMDFLNRHPNCDLVGTQATVIDECGKTIGKISYPTKYESICDTLLGRNVIIHSTWMFRKDLIDKAGLYDESASNVEDYEFLLRIARTHRVENLPVSLLKYRFNSKGISFGNNKTQEKNALQVRWKALREYGYPIWQGKLLIRPILMYIFLPSFLKKLLIRLSFKSL
jgi:glycosyltransferase involved in cell wall biosynthesis